MSPNYIEGGGRQYGARAMVGIAPSSSGAAVRAFAPYRLSTWHNMNRNPTTATRYVLWLARMVTEVLEARGAGITHIEWHTASADELIKAGGSP